MTVLIQPDLITVERPTATVDEHGWAEDGSLVTVGAMKGTIQQGVPDDDPRASEGGGEGPTAPSHRQVGIAYLTAQVQPGDVLTVTDTEGEALSWRVQNCRLVEDPTGGGYLNCWVADVSQMRVQP